MKTKEKCVDPECSPFSRCDSCRTPSFIKPRTRRRVRYEMGCGHSQSEWMEGPQIASAGGQVIHQSGEVVMRHPGRSAYCVECDTLRPITSIGALAPLKPWVQASP